MEAMRRIGEVRSALARGDQPAAVRELLSARHSGESGHEELRAYAEGVDSEILSGTRLAPYCKWSTIQSSLSNRALEHASDANSGRVLLRYGSLALRLLGPGAPEVDPRIPDLGKLVHEWSTRVPRALCEEGAVVGAHVRGLIRELCEVKEAWVRGELRNSQHLVEGNRIVYRYHALPYPREGRSVWNLMRTATRRDALVGKAIAQEVQTALGGATRIRFDLEFTAYVLDAILHPERARRVEWNR